MKKEKEIRDKLKKSEDMIDWLSDDYSNKKSAITFLEGVQEAFGWVLEEHKDIALLYRFLDR